MNPYFNAKYLVAILLHPLVFIQVEKQCKFYTINALRQTPSVKVGKSVSLHIPCRLRISAWFGLQKHEQNVDFGMKGNIVIEHEKVNFMFVVTIIKNPIVLQEQHN